MSVRMKGLFGGIVLGVAAAAVASPSYVDPNISDPNVTMLFSGTVRFDPVPTISMGDVYVDYWAFKHVGDAGYFYAYSLRNVSGSNLGGTPGALNYFGLNNLAPYTMLGLGGGQGAGSTYSPWIDIGDATNAEWQGTTAKNIRMGKTSPQIPDTAQMYEIHSIYAPGGGFSSVATTSGGGYSGQGIDVYVPVVPEPGAVAAIAAGLAGFLGLRRRK